jgi:polyisoprenoid-binding protein YceI
MVRSGIAAVISLVVGLGMTAASAPRRVAPAPEPVRSAELAPAAADTLHLVVAPTGNQARYRVREQLVGKDLPNDAVGVTNEITGTLSLTPAGAVIPSESKFVVGVTTLKSDRDRRDGYVQRRILETEQFPSVQLAPTALRGLSGSWPTSGTKTLELQGDLTVHGVTRPTTWHVEAQFSPAGVTGTASTRFTFADFGLTQPRVPILLSVSDSIGLEYDFNLVLKSSADR